MAIRQGISRNLRDPNFTVDDAAKLAGVKVRYANVLLGQQNTSWVG